MSGRYQPRILKHSSVRLPSSYKVNIKFEVVKVLASAGDACVTFAGHFVFTLQKKRWNIFVTREIPSKPPTQLFPRFKWSQSHIPFVHRIPSLQQSTFHLTHIERLYTKWEAANASRHDLHWLWYQLLFHQPYWAMVILHWMQTKSTLTAHSLAHVDVASHMKLLTKNTQYRTDEHRMMGFVARTMLRLYISH